ncbi:nitrilase-related carbon-nitrogen hydrolase [Kineobactrum salinum]|uniref:Nitrilase n=1 Tax=Kineobactrum salinum TaxID=2708301 RepID=A0A6C0U5X3_9GAMM|nr:nitrilase-related carbon-nitrogen hydrolase [Kineobactrum salinum]QIB67396.1 nitrilase [Kineobactrum salinum]
MTTVVVDKESRAVQGGAAFVHGDFRYLWLGLGAVFSLFAVGARWDVPLAAWVAPVLLLRFVRLSRPLAGLSLLLVVSVAGALWWSVQLAVPLEASMIAACITFGTVFSVPYVLDRWLAPRVDVVGRLLLFPSAIVTFEFAMATISPLGTSYGTRAITQSEHLALLQILSITGPYGIGFLIGWFATLVNHVWEEVSWKSCRIPVGAFTLVLLAVLIGGSLRLAFFQYEGDYVKIAGISPDMVVRNAAGELLESEASAAALTDEAALRVAYAAVEDELIAGTIQAAQAGAKVVVWSETAAMSLGSDERLLERATEVASEQGIYLNVAVGQPFARNDTYLIGPDGEHIWSYSKSYPVPGLEPIPPGDTPVPLVETPFGHLTNVICFDADFPALMRVDADIMLVPGWDWPEMGRTHTLKMARLRAIENGYSLFRQDYNGYSAAFDHLGRTIAGQDTTGPGLHLMFGDLPVSGTRTIYNIVGDMFAWLCVLSLFAMAAIGIVKTTRSRS